MPIHKKVFGTKLLTADYQRIYPIDADNSLRTDRWTEGDIFLDQLTSGDEVMIRLSKYDLQAQIHKVYDQQAIQGPQGLVPCYHLAALIDSWFMVEVKQTLAPSSLKILILNSMR